MDDEALTKLVDELEAALVPSGTMWPGFQYSKAREKAKDIVRAALMGPDSAEYWREIAQKLGAEFHAHTQAVATFLNELYAIMVDPVAEGSIKVEEMQRQLIEAASVPQAGRHRRVKPAPAAAPVPQTPTGLFNSTEPCPRCGFPLNQHQHSRPEGCIVETPASARPDALVCEAHWEGGTVKCSCREHFISWDSWLTHAQKLAKAAPSASVAGLAEKIDSLERIVPSDLEGEERWNRNGGYVLLDDVRAALRQAQASEEAKEIAKAQQRESASTPETRK